MHGDACDDHTYESVHFFARQTCQTCAHQPRDNASAHAPLGMPGAIHLVRTARAVETMTRHTNTLLVHPQTQISMI